MLIIQMILINFSRKETIKKKINKEINLKIFGVKRNKFSNRKQSNKKNKLLFKEYKNIK